MLLSLEGNEKTSKSTVALTAPTPNIVFSFDMGHERAILGAKYEYFEGKRVRIIARKEKATYSLDDDITIYEMALPVQLDSTKIKGCVGLWDRFVMEASKAIEDDAVQTISIDTMSLARRLKADAHLEELQTSNPDARYPRKQLLQIEWGHANGAIRDIFGLCKEYGKNLVAVHHLTDEYSRQPNSKGELESNPTGKQILEGLSTTYRHVDVAVRMERKGTNIVGKIVECGYNISMVGTEIPDLTWNKLTKLISMSLGGRIKIPEGVI